ncbi:WD40 repeat-like protein [Lepidopterella palustris CBS 459.81]|uniref:WD40 repeat-like protein n=1 Tax=Lepidopterella palustris CBS 459.81 TaxID=1314670 RepID=A0A8E2EHI8_9PEZI|nr:WD40 repeat-like protein [Lepidopterella palustris CBS 459.81]
MSSFFTTPASQRKRKRPEAPSSTIAKKRQTPSTIPRSENAPRARKGREESISGSETSGDEAEDRKLSDEESGSSSSETEGETAAEKRLRLAERYLENIKEEVFIEGFDAADIDRDLIAERLNEDVAESKGKLYRHIASKLDFGAATHTFFKADQNAMTGVAICEPYAYTISKDISVVKWEIPTPASSTDSETQTNGISRRTNTTPRRRPKKIAFAKGNKNKVKDPKFLGHTAAILSIAISSSGTYLATGDAAARMIIWNASTLTPLKVFSQHRAAVTSLSFRRGTHQLFSASMDRTIKIWSADELAYVETLFGHQDNVVGVAGGVEGKGGQEICVSVGARDRTVRLWKVVEESQLVFRGGGMARQKGLNRIRIHHHEDNSDKKSRTGSNKTAYEDEDNIAYAEGSIDCVALLDASTFVTGSDNGALSLWSVHKKKPLFTFPLAHGRDPPIPAEEMYADVNAATKVVQGPRLPRWVTAIATIPFADLILSASWDGWVRCWKVGPEKRTIEEVGVVGQVIRPEMTVNGTDRVNEHAEARIETDERILKGVVNGISVFERGDRGKDGLCIVAAVGKEHRMGRWMKSKGRNGAVVFEVPMKKAMKNGVVDDESKDEHIDE